MNKAELVEKNADGADISKALADRTLIVHWYYLKAVTKDDDVQLVGFGAFKSGKRAARTGRNPATGAEIKIPASKTVKFVAGKVFKDSVNKRK